MNLDPDMQVPSAGCPMQSERRRRYPTSQNGRDPVRAAPVVLKMSDGDCWLELFVSYQTSIGCWGIDIPHDGALSEYDNNPDLRDPTDVHAALRWPTTYIEQDDTEDRQRVIEESDDPIPPNAARKVTEWRRVEISGQVGFVPLFTDTGVCLIPFDDLRPETGPVCCALRKDDDGIARDITKGSGLPFSLHSASQRDTLLFDAHPGEPPAGMFDIRGRSIRVPDLTSHELGRFTCRAWESLGLSRAARFCRKDVPMLIDDGSLFVDERRHSPPTVVNRWLRELPTDLARGTGGRRP
jgi:hypothetical protein